MAVGWNPPLSASSSSYPETARYLNSWHLRTLLQICEGDLTHRPFTARIEARLQSHFHFPVRLFRFIALTLVAHDLNS